MLWYIKIFFYELEKNIEEYCKYKERVAVQSEEINFKKSFEEFINHMKERNEDSN